MSDVDRKYIICDYCQGVIPDNADQIKGINGSLQLGGEVHTFNDLDFCCSAHMISWVDAQPQVAIPNPPYNPVPS